MVLTSDKALEDPELYSILKARGRKVWCLQRNLSGRPKGPQNAAVALTLLRLFLQYVQGCSALPSPQQKSGTTQPQCLQPPGLKSLLVQVSQVPSPGEPCTHPAWWQPLLCAWLQIRSEKGAARCHRARCSWSRRGEEREAPEPSARPDPLRPGLLEAPHQGKGVSLKTKAKGKWAPLGHRSCLR